MQTDDRGEPQIEVRPHQFGCITGLLAMAVGLALILPGLFGHEAAARYGARTGLVLLVAGIAFLAVGLLALLAGLGDRLLVSSQGIVLCNWRGRHRVVPWDELESIEVAPNWWGTSVRMRLVLRGASGLARRISIASEWFPRWWSTGDWPDPYVWLLRRTRPLPRLFGLAADIAEIAGMEPATDPERPFSTVYVWRRPGDGGHAD